MPRRRFREEAVLVMDCLCNVKKQQLWLCKVHDPEFANRHAKYPTLELQL